MLNEAVANQAAIDECINGIAVEFLDLRLRNEPMQPQTTGLGGRTAVLVFFFAPPGRRLRQSDVSQWQFRRDRDQLVERLLSEYLIYAFAVAGYGRCNQHGIGGGMQLKMLIGMGQRIVRDQRSNMRQLSGFRLQEFFSSGSIKEEIADSDGCSRRKSSFFHAKNFPAIDF